MFILNLGLKYTMYTLVLQCYLELCPGTIPACMPTLLLLIKFAAESFTNRSAFGKPASRDYIHMSHLGHQTAGRAAGATV